ncbi:hypothetical protein C5S36_11390 [Candidatus Methanophagaceae archaeon]|nr:hypothetical protein C5S36_11390 [Methanophagales archaeon]
MWTLFSVIVVFVLSTGVQAHELTEVPASDILEQIENKEDIFLEHVRITGKLDLCKIQLETVPIARPSVNLMFYGLEKELKIVESNIIIQDSVFEEDVDFSNTEFREYIDFRGTTFFGEVDSEAANFAGYACFGGANFTGDTEFVGANFTSGADFWDVNFAGYASFEDANFTGHAGFVGANFAGDASFEDANFAGDAIFEDVDFAGYAIFEDVDFAGDASFAGANFAGDADFGHANFTGHATFLSTEFDEVSFTGTIFTNVSLNETDFNHMNVEWCTLKDALVFNGLAYVKLIKNFRAMEQFVDADDAYYQYRQLSQKNKKWSFSKLMDVVAGVSCGYGVKPGRPLIWGFILIIVFALVYKLGNGIKRLKGNDDNRVSFWDAFYFSVTTFTTVGYGDWYPIDRYRIVVMIEGVFGWLLLALFLVTLANVMIKP